MLNAGSEPTAKNVSPRRNIALLCDYCDGIASTIIDHIEGLVNYSQHKFVPINFRGDMPSMVDLDRFDAVAIHYSLIACADHYLAPAARVAIRNFSGLKIAFVQDDYRFIDDTVDALHAMGIHLLFGLAQEEVIDEIYKPSKLPGTRRETVLAGYVPEKLLHRIVPPFRERRLDIGYRARKVPDWLGSFAQEKWQIGARVLEDADRFELRCDISSKEEDRLYGDCWTDFLTDCKAVLGTESGASVCDFTGEIQAAVEAHVVKEPDVSFETLRDLYFKDVDGRLTINVISPRCFEAAALRTLMILYEGHYSGRLEPWRHYVPLKKDHSNMEEVVAVLRDPGRAEEIIDRAYEEVALNRRNWFASMVSQVDQAIDATFTDAMLARKHFYREHELSKMSQRMAKQAQKRHRLQTLHVNVHVKAVRALDAVLGLMPDKAKSRTREGFRRQFHRLRELRRQMYLLKATDVPLAMLFSTSFRDLLRISKEVGAEQDVRDILLIRSTSSKIKDASIQLAYDADKRHCRIELVDAPFQCGVAAPVISPDALGSLIDRDLVDRYVYRGADCFSGIDQTLAVEKDLTGLATIAKVKPAAVISLMSQVCEHRG